MAVILYKGDEEVRIEPQYLHQYLQAGWQLEKYPEPQEISDEVVAPEETPEEVVAPEATLEEVRNAAKEAGIEGWETKHKKTLERELADENES